MILKYLNIKKYNLLFYTKNKEVFDGKNNGYQPLQDLTDKKIKEYNS